MRSVLNLRSSARQRPFGTMSIFDLQTLLAWEMAHGERPPFVTMLTNRITAVLEE
jgi:hypothetical protein